MKNPVCVQVLQPKGHFNEELPNSTLSQMLSHLAFEILAQVLILAKLHHYVELVTRLERIIEADDVIVL